MTMAKRYHVTHDEIAHIDMDVRSGRYRYDGLRATGADMFSDATGIEMRVYLDTRGQPDATVEEVIYLAPPLSKDGAAS